LLSGNAVGTIHVMRSIIHNLRQTEIQNADLASNWAHTEIKQAAELNNNIGNVPEMAQNANQLAGVLHQFNNSANQAAFQLGNLEKMLDELKE
jgi:hypothetical protein